MEALNSKALRPTHTKTTASEKRGGRNSEVRLAAVRPMAPCQSSRVVCVARKFVLSAAHSHGESGCRDSAQNRHREFTYHAQLPSQKKHFVPQVHKSINSHTKCPELKNASTNLLLVLPISINRKFFRILYNIMWLGGSTCCFKKHAG